MVIIMIEINEQCRKCIHFQVCSSALKEELYLREILLEEENPKCKMFVEEAHGRWEEYQVPHIMCCSECDWATGVQSDFNYCPNCGAKMTRQE